MSYYSYILDLVRFLILYNSEKPEECPKEKFVEEWFPNILGEFVGSNNGSQNICNNIGSCTDSSSTRKIHQIWGRTRNATDDCMAQCEVF